MIAEFCHPYSFVSRGTKMLGIDFKFSATIVSRLQIFIITSFYLFFNNDGKNYVLNCSVRGLIIVSLILIDDTYTLYIFSFLN